MFGIQLGRAREKIVAVADIGSGSAAIAILALKPGVPATVLAAKRSVLPLQERGEEATITGIGERLVEAGTAALASYSAEIQKGRGAVTESYAILRAPWSRSTTARAARTFEQETVVTESVIGELGKQALASNARLDRKNFLEASVVRAELNGYRTGEPVGKRAREAAVVALASDCDPRIRAEAEVSLQKVFPHLAPRFRSITRALIFVLHERADAQGDYVLVDVASEGTTMVVVREGVAVDHIDIEEGMRSILKKLSDTGTPEETLSLMRMLARDECSDPACEAIKSSLARVEPELVRILGEVIGKHAAKMRLPNAMLLIAHPDVAPWLSRFFSRIDFTQFTLTSQPFDVEVLSPEDFAAWVVPERYVTLDSGLALASALVNTKIERRGFLAILDRVAMAKDYFQDITPPEDTDSVSAPPPRSLPDPNIRGIRNIAAPPRPRPTLRPGLIGADMRESPGVSGMQEPPRRRFSPIWIRTAAVAALLILASLLLIAFRSTTVTVTPKSYAVELGDAVQFTAYPSAQALPDTLTYTVQTFDLDDSEVTPAQGVVHVENKASGEITVYNTYSAASVRLIKNTRFQTHEGLIFRAPADIVIPGKSGTTPGRVEVTVVADQPGEKYNIGPVERFTLPGLRSSPDMYATVYAQSSASMGGGVIGEEPGVTPDALEVAKAEVRARLEVKARESASAHVEDGATFFPGLMQIRYESGPNTAEAGSRVRIHQKARVEIPVFPADLLAITVARMFAADESDGPIELVLQSGVTARFSSAGEHALGTDAIHFALTGKAHVVWKIDATALSAALAGRDSAAFQTIANGFASIEEARARIEPFWKTTFPADPSDIKIVVTPVASE